MWTVEKSQEFRTQKILKFTIHSVDVLSVSLFYRFTVKIEYNDYIDLIQYTSIFD